ncbi:MAG: aldehyde dehydrogenase [Granulosicoccus sp.]
MTLEITNPAKPATVVATYATIGVGEIDEIIEKATAAQATWKDIPQPERGRLLRRYLDALSANADRISQSITAEMGKIRAESEGEVAKSIAEGHAAVDRASAPIGEVFPSQFSGVMAYTMRRPRGVVLGITPWNFPFGTPVRKSIPAMLYGNSIILKPATIAPGAVAMMVEIAKGILPDNLIQAAIGSGTVGQAMCEHEGIDAVTFTGSVKVGKIVAAAASSHLAEVNLELGGKNPVVFNDASNLDEALGQVFKAAFAIGGQRCTAISRVLVNEAIEKDVVAGLAKLAAAVTPSDGSKAGATFGPLSSKQQLDEVVGFVERAQAEGASIAAGGMAMPNEEGGYYYLPTILSGVSSDMEVAQEEVFGPVLAVIPYSDIDKALEIANSTAYGLTCSLYSEQAPIIDTFLQHIDSGMLHVNSGTFPENHLPFVGAKDSALGVGGSNGPSVMQFYTSEHTVYRKGQA